MSQKKLISLFALASSLCVVSSCGSGSSNNGGQADNSSPDLNLANPEGFKNTVNTQQLAGKLGELSTMQGEIESRLNIPAQGKATANLNGRFMQAVQGFAKGSAKKSLPFTNVLPFANFTLPNNNDDSSNKLPDPNAEMQVVQQGDSCDDAMSSIANYYKSAAIGLQTAATKMLDTLNNNEAQNKLPTGVSKLGATDAYAGGYSIDLGTLQKNMDSEASKDFTMSGTVKMMAGADDTRVVFETNASNVNIVSTEGAGGAKLSAAGKMVGNLSEQSIQSQAKLNLALNIACENRSDGSVNLTGDMAQDTEISGGKTPTVSDKMMVNVTANSPCANQQGAITMKIGADFTAKQTDADTMKVSIALNLAGTDANDKPVSSNNKFEFVMTRDNFGTCKVSVASMNGKPMASNGDSRRGTRR